MRSAVMRVVVDAEGRLSAAAYEAGLAELRSQGIEFVASPAALLPRKGREVELILDEEDLTRRAEHVALCARAFGTAASAGVVTFISRGTDDDVRRVLDAFGVGDSRVERRVDGDDELLTVTLDPESAERVAEGRLHTALEAALNCEVRIVVASRPATSPVASSAGAAERSA